MHSSPFFFAGGTLRRDAQSYVRRRADDDLYEGLLRGEFCYILTARQMGKSSLMVRVGARLQEAGTAVAILDLTAIGQNLRPEEWYGGLAIQLGHRLGMTDEVMSFWHGEPVMGPLQYWIKMIHQVILPRCSHKQIVIFIDEIDMVRSLPFSADEFFAGIRQCYNERAEHEEMDRLSFCLLGVAAPTDLIRDTRMTPFNIGRRIELHDFTSEEAAPLARGLADRHGFALLKRVMYWTGGHPYLTQRMCLEISQRTSIDRPQDVDALCATLFFAYRAQERDDNLLFVRDRMLRGDVDRGGLLDLYWRIRGGATIRDDDTNPLAGPLHLSGIVRTLDGKFKVRNRIYSRVFDQRWVETMMPDAELRRQKAAFRRGIWRAALVAALVVTIGIAITLIAFRQGQERANRRLLYDTNMRLAQDAWNHSYVDRVEELLHATAPQSGQEDLRGFEWYLFQQLVRGDSWRSVEPYPVLATGFSIDEKLCVAEYQQEAKQPNKLFLKVHDLRARQDLTFLSVPTDAAFPRVIFSPDCKQATLPGPNHTIEQRNLQTGAQISSFEGHKDRLSDLALSADGEVLASADLSGVIKLWNPQKPEKEPRTIPRQQSWARSIALVPDGGLLAIADESLRVTLWNTNTGIRVGELRSQEGSVTGVAFSPNGSHLLMASKNGTLEVWSMNDKRVLWTLPGHSGRIESVAFLPARQLLATGSWDRTAKIWSLSAGNELETVRGHGARVSSVSFSPDGKYLITGSFDHTIKIWDIGSRAKLPRPPDTPKSYLATTFSATNDLLAFGIDQDNQAKLWNLATGREGTKFGEPEDKPMCAAFSADRKLLATGGLSQEVKLWNAATGALIRSFKDHSGYIYTVAFSPDNKLVISGGYDRVLRLWDVATGEEIARLKSNFDNSYVATFSPNGEQLASGTREGAVQLWDVGRRKVLRVFRGHIGTVRAIAFSTDGRLATAADDHTLRLWDVGSGKIVRTLGLADVLQRMTFSPDGRRLITGGVDGAVRIWDIFSGQELMTLPGHTDEVTSITFSNGGSILATSGSDGVIRMWPPMQKGTDIF